MVTQPFPRRPGVLVGIVAGGLITASLIAILFLASVLAGLPFLPFQAFDWMARTLPGSVITAGIDSMVAVIRALNLGQTSTVAKLAERTMAIAGFLVIGSAAGAVLFGVLQHRSIRGFTRVGILAGLLLGVPFALLSIASNRDDGRSVIGIMWVLAAMLGWGLALAWIHQRLSAPVPGATFEAPTVQRIGRRQFMMRLGGATATITVAGTALAAVLSRGNGRSGGAQTWSAANPMPNAGAAVVPAQGTRPEFTPLERHYQIDINTVPPAVDELEWRLRIGGLVDRPVELTLAELRDNYEPQHQFVTLACISNPVAGDLISTTRWTGVSLQALLDSVGLHPRATHLRIRSVDGFHEAIALDVVRADARVMLTYAWDGVPLERRHGFPLRIYIPDRYGMKQPKWIGSIEAIEAWEAGYWVSRGWDREARMQTTSVVDTVAVDMMIIGADAQQMRIPIGGIAHAGARGISRVEVQVDDQPWQPARLREPLSPTTWVIWRYDWPFQAGKHTFTVRCFEGDSTAQIAVESPVRPSGATGLHRFEKML